MVTKRKNEIDSSKALPIMGWREWLSLPDLGVEKLKAKIDTGARTSALHAFDMELYSRHGKDYVTFKIHPLQKNGSIEITAKAQVKEMRRVKDSGGKTTVRPVISTNIVLGSRTFEIELTLVNRDQMGFRMLLGREAVRRVFLVDPNKSFLLGKKVAKL